MKEIETPEAMAIRMRWEGIDGEPLSANVRERDASIIRARDKQIGTFLAEWAESCEDACDFVLGVAEWARKLGGAP